MSFKENAINVGNVMLKVARAVARGIIPAATTIAASLKSDPAKQLRRSQQKTALLQSLAEQAKAKSIIAEAKQLERQAKNPKLTQQPKGRSYYSRWVKPLVVTFGVAAAGTTVYHHIQKSGAEFDGQPLPPLGPIGGFIDDMENLMSPDGFDHITDLESIRELSACKVELKSYKDRGGEGGYLRQVTTEIGAGSIDGMYDISYPALIKKMEETRIILPVGTKIQASDLIIHGGKPGESLQSVKAWDSNGHLYNVVIRGEDFLDKTAASKRPSCAERFGL